jgi:hypothetical protein
MRNLSSHLPEFPKVSEIVGVAGCKRPFPRSGIRLPILESHPLGVCHFAEKLFWDAQPATQAPFEMLRVWWEGLFGPTLRAVATWAQSPKNKLEWAGWTEDKKNFLLCIHLYVSTNHWVVSYSRNQHSRVPLRGLGGSTQTCWVWLMGSLATHEPFVQSRFRLYCLMVNPIDHPQLYQIGGISHPRWSLKFGCFFTAKDIFIHFDRPMKLPQIVGP